MATRLRRLATSAQLLLRVAPEARACCLLSCGGGWALHPLISPQPSNPQPDTTHTHRPAYTALTTRGVALFNLLFARISTPYAYARVGSAPCTPLLKLCLPPNTAAMASVRLQPLLLALVLAVVLALLLPSAQAFFPQQQLSFPSSLMKHQHQHRPGTNRGTWGTPGRERLYVCLACDLAL